MIENVAPEQAYQALRDDPAATLVDVRTRPEWEFVGIPDLSPLGKRAVLLAWQAYPAMQQDPAFVAKLQAEAGPGPLYFICRSGARSHAAAVAAVAAGHTAFNVADGFEGPLGPDGHRDVAGWKVSGLPWRQG